MTELRVSTPILMALAPALGHVDRRPRRRRVDEQDRPLGGAEAARRAPDRLAVGVGLADRPGQHHQVEDVDVALDRRERRLVVGQQRLGAVEPGDVAGLLPAGGVRAERVGRQVGRRAAGRYAAPRRCRSASVVTSTFSDARRPEVGCRPERPARSPAARAVQRPGAVALTAVSIACAEGVQPGPDDLQRPEPRGAVRKGAATGPCAIGVARACRDRDRRRVNGVLDDAGVDQHDQRGELVARQRPPRRRAGSSQADVGRGPPRPRPAGRRRPTAPGAAASRRRTRSRRWRCRASAAIAQSLRGRRRDDDGALGRADLQHAAQSVPVR